jgi:hypothetical protein
VWSVNHLPKVISGDDPMQAIVDLVGDYCAESCKVPRLAAVFQGTRFIKNAILLPSIPHQGGEMF